MGAVQLPRKWYRQQWRLTRRAPHPFLLTISSTSRRYFRSSSSSLIDLLGLTIIIPLLPLYAASFQADAATIGILGATYPVMQFIGAPILGRLSDRYGRKPILIISQIGTLIGFLILGVSNTLLLLFISRALDGLSGANISTAQAIITDSTTDKTRTQGLGLLGAAFGLGFIVGPVIAFISLGLSGNNYHVPAFVAAGFSLISILLTIFVLPKPTRPKSAGRPRARRRSVSAPCSAPSPCRVSAFC
ncbi:MAG: MFS transporter [Chloroflexi bacterium]|nr:MFS transporter [Chloroflexota bacterium]